MLWWLSWQWVPSYIIRLCLKEAVTFPLFFLGGSGGNGEKLVYCSLFLLLLRICLGNSRVALLSLEGFLRMTFLVADWNALPILALRSPLQCFVSAKLQERPGEFRQKEAGPRLPYLLVELSKKQWWPARPDPSPSAIYFLVPLVDPFCSTAQPS